MSSASTSTWRELIAAAERGPSVLPSEDSEAQLFWRLRYRIAATRLRQLFTTGRLRTLLVIGLSLFFWFGLFTLFYEGFKFVVEHVGPPGASYHAQTVRFVFHLFFASLNVMLVFSSGIILYTGLYNSPETQFLLTLPVRAGADRALQVSGSRVLQQLGILSAGQPDDDRLRHRRRGAVVLLLL